MDAISRTVSLSAQGVSVFLEEAGQVLANEAAILAGEDDCPRLGEALGEVCAEFNKELDERGLLSFDRMLSRQ